MNVFRRIGRALSRAGRSTTAPVPSGGAMATQVDLQQVEAAQEQEAEPEEQEEHESE
jgi:hypothetical protein